MPTEYESLVTALKATVIPFEEYGWKTRPNRDYYGVITPDMEADSADGDSEKLDRSWSTSVDVFFRKITDRKMIITTVEGILDAACGSCWEMNSNQYETQTGLFHIEWVCEVTGEITAEAGDS